MTMSMRPARFALVLILGLVIACGHDSPTQPASLQAAVPGVLSVRLSTPHSDDAALVIVVSGPVVAADVGAASGTLLHTRQSGDTITAALFGRIASGEVLHFSVPDVHAAARYAARVIQVADTTNVMRTDLTGYEIAVEQR